MVELEPYDARRVRVACPYCRRGACRACQITYVLSEALDPNCMHCKRAWSPEVIDSLFPRAFRRGELRRHTVKLLMARERGFFPHTQQAIERARGELARRPLLTLADALADEWAVYDGTRGGGGPAVPAAAAAAAPAPHATPVVRPCPADGCIGFLSSLWACGTCSVQVCPDCECIKAEASEAAHTCAADALASIATRATLAKPCPRCGKHIERESGCYQMWCTACSTAFEWGTLRIIEGAALRTFHNPHHQEFMRRLREKQREQQGASSAAAVAAAAAPDCGVDAATLPLWPWAHVGELEDALATPSARALGGVCDPLIPINRLLMERHDVVQRQGRVAPPPYSDATYRGLRVQRLLGEIDEPQWAARLSHAETVRTKRERMLGAEIVLVNVGADLLRGVLRDCASSADVRDALPAFEELRAMTNEQRRAIMADYDERLVFVVAAGWVVEGVPTARHAARQAAQAARKGKRPRDAGH